MPDNNWKDILGNLYEEMPKDPNGDNEYQEPNPEVEKWYPGADTVYIYKDKKSRNGKVVTIVEGIVAEEDILKNIAKKLKTACGVGGSVKEGLIIIQGDYKLKIKEILDKDGFKTKLKGG